MQRQKWLIISLAVLLLAACGYIAVKEYNNYMNEREMEVFQQGAQYGYEQAIIQVAGKAAGCEQVPLIIQNQSINIVAVECLQQDEE